MKTKTLLFAAVLSAVAVVAFAQPDITNSVPADTMAPVDHTIRDAIAKFSYWQFLLVPLALILTMGVKKWVTFIPDKVLPWVAPVLGAALDQIAAKAGFWTSNPAVGATMGGLATWAHQAWTQTTETDTPKPPTNYGLWFLIGVLSLGSATLVTGCGTTNRTVEAVKFDTFKTVYATARESYKTFLRYVYEGKVTQANENRARKAWDEFRVSYDASFRIANNNGSAIPPDAVIALKNQFVTIVLNLTK